MSNMTDKWPAQSIDLGSLATRRGVVLLAGAVVAIIALLLFETAPFGPAALTCADGLATQAPAIGASSELDEWALIRSRRSRLIYEGGSFVDDTEAAHARALSSMNLKVDTRRPDAAQAEANETDDAMKAANGCATSRALAAARRSFDCRDNAP